MKNNAIFRNTLISGILVYGSILIIQNFGRTLFPNDLGGMNFLMAILLYVPGVLFGIAVITSVKCTSVLKKVLFLLLSGGVYTLLTFMIVHFQFNKFVLGAAPVLGALIVSLSFGLMLLHPFYILKVKDILFLILLALVSSIFSIMGIKGIMQYIIIFLWQVSIGFYINLIYRNYHKHMSLSI